MSGAPSERCPDLAYACEQVLRVLVADIDRVHVRSLSVSRRSRTALSVGMADAMPARTARTVKHESMEVELTDANLAILRTHGVPNGIVGDTVSFEYQLMRSGGVLSAFIVWPATGTREQVEVLAALGVLDAISDLQCDDTRAIDSSA